MAIGERIHFIRSLRGMTQKYLGMMVGFSEKTADVRMAQYETGARTPKADLTAALAKELDVSPEALNVPDIDSYIGLMHTLFTLEDIYGLTIEGENGAVTLHVNPFKGKDAARLNEMVVAWAQEAKRFRTGEISQEEYDRWRHYYPQYDTTQRWAKVPSQELSDILIKDFKNGFEKQ